MRKYKKFQVSVANFSLENLFFLVVKKNYFCLESFAFSEKFINFFRRNERHFFFECEKSVFHVTITNFSLIRKSAISSKCRNLEIWFFGGIRNSFFGLRIGFLSKCNNVFLNRKLVLSRERKKTFYVAVSIKNTFIWLKKIFGLNIFS